MKNKKIMSVLCSVLLSFAGTSKTCCASDCESESENITVSKSNNMMPKPSSVPTQESHDVLSLESGDLEPEPDNTSIWESVYKIGKIASKIAAWGSVVVSSMSLITLASIINDSRKGIHKSGPFDVDLVFGVGSAILCPVSGLAAWGFFKLAKYFDSKKKRLKSEFENTQKNF